MGILFRSQNALSCQTIQSLDCTTHSLTSYALQISINQTERTLKIVGERQRNSEQPADEQESRPRFRKQLERSMGKFSRTIVLDKEADLSAVSAR